MLILESLIRIWRFTKLLWK